MIYYDTWTSPLGDIMLRANEQALTGLFFSDQKYCPTRPGAWRHAPDHPPLRQAREEMVDFFAGTREHFSVPLQMNGSAFQQRVWRALAEIPYGTVVSYGEIARRLGVGGGHARAVGSATGHNPISIIVPCHRVLSSIGKLTGYAGGLDRKRALLTLENADAITDANLQLTLLEPCRIGAPDADVAKPSHIGASHVCT
jgi:methylated-DNA-[protein]-cysteine S-methyltransferase